MAPVLRRKKRRRRNRRRNRRRRREIVTRSRMMAARARKKRIKMPKRMKVQRSMPWLHKTRPQLQMPLVRRTPPNSLKERKMALTTLAKT